MRAFLASLAFMFVACTSKAGPPIIWSSPYPKVLKAGIQFSGTEAAVTCNSAAAGSIRWNGTAVQACDGISWASVGAASFAMGSGVWLTGNSINLIRNNSTDVEVGTTSNVSIIRGANIQMYTTGSGDITLNPANGEINVLGNGSTISGMLRLHDGDTAQIVDLKASVTTTASYVINLPPTKGTANMEMVYDGTDTLNFLERYDVDITITAGGTTGVQTINKPAGRINIAAAESSKVVNNSLVDTSTLVFAAINTADTTCTLKNVVAGAGIITITTTANCAAETAVSWHIIK